MNIKKIGSVNPCNLLVLMDKYDRQIGTCLDTPNSFAVACIMNDKVCKGKADYQLFKTEYRYKDDKDIKERIKSYEKFKDNVLEQEYEHHKQFIRFY